MMKLLFFLMLPFALFGQTEKTISGQVFDENDQPLPYVNIGIVGTTTGTVSGVDGVFKLYLPNNNLTEGSLRFSMVGYEAQSFSLADFKAATNEDVSVKLTPASTILSEVVVRPKFAKKKQLGLSRKHYGMSNSFAISKKPNQNLGAEIGRRFSLPGKETVLDTFRFFVSGNSFDTVRFRINIYDLKNSKPNKNLLKENIIVELTDRQKGWVKIDLTPYNLSFKKDIAIGVEWIYHSEKGKSLYLPIGLFSSTMHFYKYGSQGKWKRFPGMATAMRLDVSFKR